MECQKTGGGLSFDVIFSVCNKVTKPPEVSVAAVAVTEMAVAAAGVFAAIIMLVVWVAVPRSRAHDPVAVVCLCVRLRAIDSCVHSSMPHMARRVCRDRPVRDCRL